MPVLKTLVEPDTKTRFRAMAQARGLSESELLRALLLTATGQDKSGAGGAPVEPHAQRAALERMTVRMPRFLLDAIKARSKTKGMAPSRWMLALVQSHLTRNPVMTANELSALQANIRELSAIGRNINQIAHALNSFHETERLKLEHLAQLRQTLADNRAAIRVLVRASQNAWEAGDGTD